jgi:hypothetical protein
VKISNGQRIRVQGLCRGVELLLQGLLIKVDCYLFPLNGEDFVLGIEWLEKLGEVKANFKDMSLKLKVNGETVCLRGFPLLSWKEVSAKQIMMELQDPEEMYIIDCRSLKVSAIETEGERRDREIER